MSAAVNKGRAGVLQDLFRDFDKAANAEQRQAEVLREDGVGLLTPELLKQFAAKGNTQDLVLAYGRSGATRTYTPAELRRFVQTLGKRQEQFNKAVQGVAYSSLLRSSLPVDKERARTVRNATLYQRKGNILFFQVSGNTRRFYRVQIRLEAWQDALTAATPPLKAVQQAIAGRISFECPCGRHQYWYRYLATIGNFAIEPLERDYPKIRNPRLTGCCCKHVLRTLDELKKSRVRLVLARQLEAERKKPGFKSTQRKVVFSQRDLQELTRRRISASAAEAYKRYREQANKIRAELRPRGMEPGKKLPATDRALVNAIKEVLRVARQYGSQPDTMLDAIAKTTNTPRERIDAIIKERGLDQ